MDAFALFVLQPQPASHTSENPPLCGHPETTPTNPPCHAGVVLNRRRYPGIGTLEEEKSRPWCVVMSVWAKTRRVPRHKEWSQKEKISYDGWVDFPHMHRFFFCCATLLSESCV